MSFCLNHLHVHYDSEAWPLDSIGVFFVWITRMCIMTAKHGQRILLVSFCLNHLYVHYDWYVWPLDSIGVFLSESLACALWQLSMATGLYWCLFLWITCTCIMTAKHGHCILLVSFLSESLVCALWQLSMAKRFYWCLFVWITCTCFMTAKHGHWILLVSFCLNHLYVHYDS